jgi:hypothetical protein
MAFLPVNVFLAVLFLFGIVWGWEGEELRQFFAVVSSIFMFPLWLTPLFSIVDDTVCCTFKSNPGWLPTLLLVNLLWWNVALMYFTGAHLISTLGREDPLSKGFKRLRK